MAFVVPGQAAVGGEPGEGPLDRPAARDDREPALVGGFAHDVQRGAQDRGGPVEQPAGEPGVGEDEPHPGAQIGVEQDGFGPVAVLHAGGEDHHAQQQAQGVGDDEPLAPVDLLPGVVATGVTPDGVRSAHGLGVDQPGRGLRVAAFLHAQLPADHRQDLLGDLGLFPLVEVPVHGLPGREIRRQRPPGAPGADHVEDRVDHRAARVLLRAPTRPDRRQQRLDQRPLLVAGVGGVALLSTCHHARVDHLAGEVT